jgi:ribosomal protein S18 acetylase RimI-like enzyme
MTSSASKIESIVRPLQYRDWEAVESLLGTVDDRAERAWLAKPLVRRTESGDRHPFVKVLNTVPGQWPAPLRTYVLEQSGQIVGAIQVSPFNQARSTWRVERVCIAPAARSFDNGTQLLRYCLETIWEARTWLVEVEVNHLDVLGLYRQNGFQPLAQLTQWQLSAQNLEQLATQSPSLPNLLPINNADASLLYQLDTAAMPPFVRQVFDRHLQDFQRNLLNSLVCNLQRQFQNREWTNGYVFEPQRKAAIGYFSVCLSRTGEEPITAQMTVHPAYTWLYAELMAHMARLSQHFCPSAPMVLVSADYQPEREEYLQQIGAERLEHTLMLSRSVWHKVRESKTLSLETLQLTEMLQGLQPNHTPVPGRMTFFQSAYSSLQTQGGIQRSGEENRSTLPNNHRQSEHRSQAPSDRSDPHGSCG